MYTFIQFGSKKPQYYKGLLVNADPGLHEEVMALIQRKLPINASVLDLGAGEGAMSQRLFDAGYKVLSVDVALERFKARGPEFLRVNFDDRKQVDAFTERYENYFDAAIGMEVIEHLENPWEYVRLLRKIVKKGGRIVITTPNISSWLSRLYFLFTGNFFSFNDKSADEYGHIAPISPWELLLILKRENITNTRMMQGGSLPTLWITSNLFLVFSTLLALFFRPFMRGHSKGYCIIITGEK